MWGMNQVQFAWKAASGRAKEIKEGSSPPYLFEMPLVPFPTVLQAGQVELRLVAHAELPGTLGDAASDGIYQSCC